MTQVDSVSLKEILRFPFRSPGWATRFFVGAALVFAGFWIPILPWIFVAGYLVQVMREVLEDRGPSLPGWEDWGQLGRDGLRATGIGLVYLLPGTLVNLFGIGVYFVVALASSLAAEGSKAGEEAALLAILFAVVVLFLSLFIGTLLFLMGLIPLPMALAEFVSSDKFAAAFRLRRLWEVMRADGWGYLAAWVVLLGVGAITYIAMMLTYYTGVLCWLMPFVSATGGFYMYLVGAALFGQVYRENVGSLGGA